MKDTEKNETTNNVTKRSGTPKEESFSPKGISFRARHRVFFTVVFNVVFSEDAYSLTHALLSHNVAGEWGKTLASLAAFVTGHHRRGLSEDAR